MSGKRIILDDRAILRILEDADALLRSPVVTEEVAKMCGYVKDLAWCLTRLRDDVRRHRSSYLGGNRRCWKDNEVLYSSLPEGYTPPARDIMAELEECKKYLSSCHDPRVKYECPQERIEALEAVLRDIDTIAPTTELQNQWGLGLLPVAVFDKVREVLGDDDAD